MGMANLFGKFLIPSITFLPLRNSIALPVLLARLSPIYVNVENL